MSFSLCNGTRPNGLLVKTFGLSEEVVFLGEYQLSLNDFLAAVRYVLTNADLIPGDPRLAFIAWVRRLEAAPGWNRDGTRLAVRNPNARPKGGTP